MGEGKCCRFSFPIYQPIWSSPPTVAIDEEREVRIMEEEFAIEPFNRDRYYVFSCDKVKRCVCVVQQRLSLESFEAYDFKATGTRDTKLGTQEVDG